MDGTEVAENNMAILVDGGCEENAKFLAQRNERDGNKNSL